MIGFFLVTGATNAAELHAVREGDTIESIAETLGSSDLGPVIRVLNRLKRGEQPEVGRLIELPPSVLVRQVEQRALLVTLHGNVTVGVPGEARRSARQFGTVSSGHEVCAGPRSFTTLQLATSCEGGEEAGDLAVLMADSCLEILSLVASPLGRSSVVRLTQGSLVVPDVEGNGSTVAVQTADGIAIGPGGFRSHLENGETARLEAVYRPITMVSTAGEQQELAAGTGARVAKGGAISEAVALLRAVQLQTPREGSPLRRPVFTWTPSPDAFGYQMTVAAHPDHQEVLYQEPMAEPIHAPSQLLLPNTPLWWRVTPIDRLGFQGIPSPPRPLLPPGPPTRVAARTE